jgi:hypothetical protein
LEKISCASIVSFSVGPGHGSGIGAFTRSATPQDHAAKMNQTFVPKPLNEMHL